jgi:nitrous oxidase accessory protein NosD
LVTGNTITDNEYGIKCGHTNSPYSRYNVITNNDITFNTKVGVETNGWFNKVFNNNFIGNTNHALCNRYSAWDDGYVSGGNYWDDHNSPDIDEDGIVDSPRLVSGYQLLSQTGG